MAQLRRHRPRKRSASRVPDSLLVLTARSIARDVHSFDISQLPPDLAQLVFSELLCSSTIDEATFRIFGKQNVYEFDCSEQSSVTDSWLGHFGGCPLHRVSLASCVQVRMSLVQFCATTSLFYSGTLQGRGRQPAYLLPAPPIASFTLPASSLHALLTPVLHAFLRSTSAKAPRAASLQ